MYLPGQVVLILVVVVVWFVAVNDRSVQWLSSLHTLPPRIVVVVRPVVRLIVHYTQ